MRDLEGITVAKRGPAEHLADSPRSIDVRAYVYLFLMVLLGSSTAPAAKFAVRELPAGLLPLIRFGVAGACLFALITLRGSGQGFWRMVREDPVRLALAALFCVPINQAFFLNGARLAPTSHVALIYASCPLVVLAVATWLGQEKFVPGRFVGVLASVVGVAVIALESAWSGGKSGRSTFQGDLLLVGAVVSWGLYLTVSKPLIVRHRPIVALAGTFLVGALLQIPITLITIRGWPPLGEASRSAWFGLAFLTLVATIIGLAFQNLAMQRLDASQVANFNNAGPVLTIAWGVWLFGEALSPALIFGGLLTLGGIIWASRPGPSQNVVRFKPVPEVLPGVAIPGR